jgi:hypothetical protein
VSSSARLAMMQAAYLRNGSLRAVLGRLDVARHGRVAVQRQMRARMVVIIEVFGVDAFQVRFALECPRFLYQGL